MYNTSKKSYVQELDFIFTPKSFEQFMGTLWPKNWKKMILLVVIVSFLLIESNVIPALKAFMKGLISSSYTDELWAIYEDIMA